MTQSIDETLAERGSRYGEFTDHAAVTQSIKEAMSVGNNWECNLEDDQKECLEMIAHKIGRILNGDPDYIDSWTDIIGYTRLVEKRLIDEQKPATVKADGMSSGTVNIKAALAAALAARHEYDEDDEDDGVVAQEDPPCDDPACFQCHPKLAHALKTLLDAGVIKHID